MPRQADGGRTPDWEALYETAAAQAGYFSLAQARDAGYSPQLLQYYLGAGRVERSLRGMFRLVHFPPSEHEDLVPVWLWSGREGVFGLETALAMHQLSDALPSRHDLLVPEAWGARRLRVPRNVRLIVEDVPRADRQWMGPVPVTKPARTLRDCLEHHVPRELVDQAIAQAVKRRLVTRDEARAIKREAA